MLYDVAVLLEEDLTAELVDVLMDSFSFAHPSVGRTYDNEPGAEVFLTYDAHSFQHALRVIEDGLHGISHIKSVSIDVVNGDARHLLAALP